VFFDTEFGNAYIDMPALNKKKLLNKQIPTMLGLGILIIALVAGLLFFGEGTGVFAPRADASVTPKKIKLTNITDKSFTVSFFTDGKSASFIKYGEDEGSLSSQASDDRDQLSGSISEFNTHHITIRGLKSNTTYYYVLGTGSNSTFDNNGQKFAVKTAATPTAPPPAAKTVYGNILNPGGTPAEGSVVYISIDGVGLLSALVKSSGSWAMPLSNARSTDGSNFAQITDTTGLNILVQGDQAGLVSNVVTTVANGQPVENIKLGESSQSATSEDLEAPAADGKALAVPEEVDTYQATTSAGVNTEAEETDMGEEIAIAPTSIPTVSVTGSPFTGGTEDDNAPASTASSILYLNENVTASTSVTTAVPVFSGQAIPNVEVKIEIHSDSQISTTTTTDSNGEFQVNLEELKENLDPGEHTITLTYTDPETQQEVSTTYTFTVEDTSSLLAQVDDDSIPYGTGSPYPMSTPTSTPAPTPIPTLTLAPSLATPTPAPTVAATDSATTKGGATRSAVVATDSGVYTAGSVDTTLILVVGGLFFIITGMWSWWVSSQLEMIETPKIN
jgi:purple acid phosphatase-like protein